MVGMDRKNFPYDPEQECPENYGSKAHFPKLSNLRSIYLTSIL